MLRKCRTRRIIEIEMAKGVFARKLRSWATARGYVLTIADIGVVETVRKKLDERRASGMIDAAFFEENLTKFRYLQGVSITGSKCLVMVAVPSPISVLPVTIGRRKIDALIPPTYVSTRRLSKNVLDDMKENALGGCAEAEILKAPLKSLAAHMGLVSYGRNNITYVPGLGSGHQLCGYLVGTGEEPVEGCANAEGRETVLERCASCTACLKACPTGAIREDRFLISAERCFTLLSESRSPMPGWARPPKSLCLIGCMNCQQVCPENKGRLKTVPSGVEFTAEETEAVIEEGRRLAAGGPDASPAAHAEKASALASARAKFEELGMSEDLDLMGRNLDFIRRRRSSRRP
jgi:epoxyqueuosine reductase